MRSPAPVSTLFHLQTHTHPSSCSQIVVYDFAATGALWLGEGMGYFDFIDDAGL